MKRFSCSLVFRSIFAAITTLLPIAAHAQDQLTETLTPEPRPYPYAILDIQPGAEAMDAASMFGERMMLILVPEQVALRVENGEGRAFVLTFDQKLVTQGVGLHTRMGRDPYTQTCPFCYTEMDARADVCPSCQAMARHRQLAKTVQTGYEVCMIKVRAHITLI